MESSFVDILVEWSTDETFEKVEGEQLVMDMRSLQYTVDGLEKVRGLYFNISSNHLFDSSKSFIFWRWSEFTKYETHIFLTIGHS